MADNVFKQRHSLARIDDLPSELLRHVAFMHRCVELAKATQARGEDPFGSVLVVGGRIIAEAASETNAKNDKSCHAELQALREAAQLPGIDFQRATLYSSCEPCAMCSFMIREYQVGCVVFGTLSPIMGGYSRWNVLDDPRLHQIFPEDYGPQPAILPGFLASETDALFMS